MKAIGAPCAAFLGSEVVELDKQAFYRRAVQVRDAEVKHFGARAGKSTQHCQYRCDIRLPYPPLPYRSLMPPGQCSLFEMFRLSAALGFGVSRFLEIMIAIFRNYDCGAVRRRSA